MDKQWKLFEFGDVFTGKRGRRLIETDQSPGEIAYISSTKNNNGLSAFINPPDFMTRYEKMITIANSGSVGYCFYHDFEFVASDHVTVIGIKDKKTKLNSNIALFLKPIFESMRYKYNFGREISDARLRRESFLLPIKQDSTPDWEFMESYIEQTYNQISWVAIEHSASLENAQEIAYGEFPIEEIFYFKKGKRLTKENMRPGKTYFIGAISVDNGIREQIDEEPLHVKKCITVNYNGSVGEAYYQENPFWASDDVNILYPKNWEINKYNALYLVTVIKENRYLFSYGRKWTLDKMKRTKLLLPMTHEGSPNYDYMVTYIKSLPYSDRI